ncbi:MAG: hypothetical protein Q9211_001022 [Gyalolechia sp. 1 TL-2023]
MESARSDPERDELLSQFSNLTGCAPSEARQYLDANQWDLAAAAAEYYTSLEEAAAEARSSSEAAPENDENKPPPAQLAPGGGRTLGGNPVPQPIPTTSSMTDQSSSSSRAPPKKKFATLGDLGGGSSAGHAGQGHGDDSDDSDYDPKQDLFAGGEKSGLAVQNPDDMRRKILERARKQAIPTNPLTSLTRTNPPSRNLPRPEDPSAPSRPTPTNFTGTARTLGGEDTPSQVIPGSSIPSTRTAPPVERVLHFWTDGFSVDDGPLYRNDDPANAEILAHIRQGRAPMDILNVERNQEADVKLDMHKEKYKPPKKKYKPFGGGGQRLGSPTLGDGGMVSIATSQQLAGSTASSAAATASISSSSSSAMHIDDAQPTISLQIRLGDGTRLVSRFNTTHTIGDVYDFVTRSSSTQGREFALMTTFPSTELKDQSRVLGQMSEFKRGGTIVQKWI